MVRVTVVCLASGKQKTMSSKFADILVGLKRFKYLDDLKIQSESLQKKNEVDAQIAAPSGVSVASAELISLDVNDGPEKVGEKLPELEEKIVSDSQLDPSEKVNNLEIDFGDSEAPKTEGQPNDNEKPNQKSKNKSADKSEAK